MRHFSFIALLLVLVSQSPVGAQEHLGARQKLKEMNISFTNDAFIHSITDGNKATVELFLAAGMNPNSTYEGKDFFIGNRVVVHGQTALMLAIFFGHDDIVSLILNKGANVNQPGPGGWFPLASAKGALVKQLLDRGADVNQRADYGQTALMEGAGDGDLEKISLLLEGGGDINAKNRGGFSALVCAGVYRQRAAAKLLITRGADLSGFSERALRMMTMGPDDSDPIVQLIGKLYGTISKYRVSAPSQEDEEQSQSRLLEIGNESDESRARVIDHLLDVVEDPAAQHAEPLAYAWITAVKVLGILQATEAIDILVQHLNQDGQTGLGISLSFKPVYKALVYIGEPAVPKLIEALSHSNPIIREQAAWTLKTIDPARARTAIDVAYQNELDETVRATFKSVIDSFQRPPE